MQYVSERIYNGGRIKKRRSAIPSYITIEREKYPRSGKFKERTDAIKNIIAAGAFAGATVMRGNRRVCALYLSKTQSREPILRLEELNDKRAAR